MSSTLIAQQPRKKGTDSKRLNAQQQMFISELLADPAFNGTRAAEKAGYSQPSVAACKLLKNPLVKNEIDAQITRRQTKLEITQVEVLNYLHTIAFFNPLKFFKVGRNGNWVVPDPEEIPDEIGCLIEYVKMVQYTNPDGSTETEFEVSLISKSLALQLMMRHHGLVEATDSRNKDGMSADDYKALLDRLTTPELVIDSKVIEKEAKSS